MATNIDNILEDKGTVVVSKGKVMWVITTLLSATIGLASFGWSLYSELGTKLDKNDKDINEKLDSDNQNILLKLEELRRYEVKANAMHISDNKYSIGILLGRTNSRYSVAESTTNRPPETNTTPFITAPEH